MTVTTSFDDFCVKAGGQSEADILRKRDEEAMELCEKQNQLFMDQLEEKDTKIKIIEKERVKLAAQCQDLIKKNKDLRKVSKLNKKLTKQNEMMKKDIPRITNGYLYYWSNGALGRDCQTYFSDEMAEKYLKICEAYENNCLEKDGEGSLPEDYPIDAMYPEQKDWLETICIKESGDLLDLALEVALA